MKETKTNVGILLFDDAYEHIGKALEPYLQVGPIGKYLYCEKAEQSGQFLCMTFDPSYVEGRIKDKMEVSIPVVYVKFMVKSSSNKIIGFNI